MQVELFIHYACTKQSPVVFICHSLWW